MEMREKIKIKCPNCGAILEAIDDPANDKKSVLCPNCRVRNRFSDFKRLVPKVIEDETQIGLLLKEAIGHLVDGRTNLRYPLKEGRNLIGRRPQKGETKASIPIDTGDRGFSRAHLYIDVIKGRDGRYHYYASNAENKNSTTINGNLLQDGDKIGLKQGDQITSSETSLRLDIPSNNDETVL